MPDELIPANTPETLGVTPRYVLQHNAISRSAHSLSATAQKLTAMAMALLPADLSSLTAAFTFTEFCKAVGYTKSGESFKVFLAALKECTGNVISLEIPLPNSKKKTWENYTWFTASKFNEETGVITMTFSPQLAEVLLELKRVYAKINLQDLGTLQSKYALRLFEMAISYESLNGKNGNHDNTWYFERTVKEFREILGISDDTYKETRDFRKKVIEEPVKEINTAGIGLEISTEGVKQGRDLVAIRLNCTKTSRKLSTKGRKKNAAKTQLELPEASPKAVVEREEKELEHLKELYPEEFATLYTDELSKPSFLPPTSEFRKKATEITVLAQLREKYGIVK
jgi:plasmid replication initiation protein